MDQKDARELEELFEKHKFKDYKWMVPSRDVIVAQWVRMKCMFGCGEYGRNAACPPNTPSIPECERFFSEYHQGVIFHFNKKVKNPEDRKKWGRDINKGLLELEKEVFIKGHEKAFVLFMDSCAFCGDLKNCAGTREECKNPDKSRPGMDAMGIDVYSTVRGMGYEVNVLKDYKEAMNRYALLLIE